MQFIWLSLTVVMGVTQIIASVLLLKEHHPGPWMMLVGACISLLAGTATQSLSILGLPLNLREHIELFYQVSGGISSLGWLCFMVGLLIYALHRRSQRHRIAELERVVESQQA